MTFDRARRLWFFYALGLGAVLVGGGLSVMGLEHWWQRALVYYAVGGGAFFAWIFGVFGFVGRARVWLRAEGRDVDEVMAWGERWFQISVVVIGLIGLAGLVALFRVDGWADRLRVFFLVGPSVMMGWMGVVFCFCAIPQIRDAGEADRGGDGGAGDAGGGPKA